MFSEIRSVIEGVEKNQHSDQTSQRFVLLGSL